MPLRRRRVVYKKRDLLRSDVSEVDDVVTWKMLALGGVGLESAHPTLKAEEQVEHCVAHLLYLGVKRRRRRDYRRDCGGLRVYERSREMVHVFELETPAADRGGDNDSLARSSAK